MRAQPESRITIAGSTTHLPLPNTDLFIKADSGAELLTLIDLTLHSDT